MARILIVDDEESDRLVAQAILAGRGHECFFAYDGDEALHQLRNYAFDVVLTDLHMPEVHGFEVIATLREFDPPPALVVMSNTGQVQLQIAEALGATYTLEKPLDPELLLDAVDRAVNDMDQRRKDSGTEGGDSG